MKEADPCFDDKGPYPLHLSETFYFLKIKIYKKIQRTRARKIFKS